MDRILESVRSSREGLELRPRDELLRKLETKVKELEAQPPGSFQPYVLEAAGKAIRDLKEADTEEELLRRVAGWVKVSMADADRARRLLTTQLGSFILTADVGGRVRNPGSHDWKAVPNNGLNLICADCGIVGYVPSWGPEGRVRAFYGCNQFARLTGRDNA